MITIVIFIISFIFISAIDYAWHLVIFKKQYTEDFEKVKKEKFVALSGLASQIIIVACEVFLVLRFAGTELYLNSVLLCGVCGILGVTVYGLVNDSLIKNWTRRLTVLEIIWGPIIGSLGGLFIAFLTTIIK